jgi:hypothetical protein
MAVASISSGGNFRVGELLSRAWQVLAPNFVFFFFVSIIVALPNVALETGRGPPALGWSLAIALIVAMILHTFGQAVMLFGAFQYLRGRQVRLAEALRRGLSRFFPLLGLGILYGLGVGFGTVLLLVPGLILLVMWAVVVPVCVVERLGPTASMSRSSDLTKGYRWKIFGIVVPLLVVGMIGRKFLPPILVPAGLVVMSIGVVLWTALWSAYSNCVLITIYHDLRVAKEGVDTGQIAEIFD